MKYIKYFVYLLRHKYHVMVGCFKYGLYWQGMVHDLSKFLPGEFCVYADKFFSSNLDGNNKYAQINDSFSRGWLYHQNRNKHHWEYWVFGQKHSKCIKMPEKYLKELLCDWAAMGILFGDNPLSYYKKHRRDIVLHPETRSSLEAMIGF